MSCLPSLLITKLLNINYLTTHLHNFNLTARIPFLSFSVRIGPLKQLNSSLQNIIFSSEIKWCTLETMSGEQVCIQSSPWEFSS